MSKTRVLRFALGGLLLATVMVVVWLIAGNPGYFSHDELQWAVFAELHRPMPALDWFAVEQFQYRPLTFHLWVLLSRLLFESPPLFHVLWLLLGALNAVLLFAALRRSRLPRSVAAVVALLFWVNPYAVFVHGWVGTLGDLLWVTAALLVVLVVSGVREERLPWSGGLLVAALSLAALLAKEAALSIPALLFVAWLFTRQRVWRDAFLASASVAGVYLLLRFGVLTDPSNKGSGYGLDLAGAPQRFLHYQLFPFFPWVEEIHTLSMHGGRRQWLALLLSVAVLLAASGSVHGITRWLLASLAALGPALLIDSSSGQYGYGLSAVMLALAAWRWVGAGRIARCLLLLAVPILCWHGIGVARYQREVGELQAVFSPSLAASVKGRQVTLSQPLALRVDCEGQRWVYQRLTHGIPSYAGVAIGARVRLLAPEDAAAGSVARIACDGRVYSPD